MSTKIALTLCAALFAFNTPALAADGFEMIQVGNVELSCEASNGVKIETKDSKNNVVEASLFGVKKEFFVSLTPEYGPYTQIWLVQEGQLGGQGYQILLAGNVPEGATRTLNGTIGRLGVPYLASITCQVYWENLLK